MQTATNGQQSIQPKKPTKMEVLVTTDYRQFKLVRGNRLINKAHANTLAKSIQKRNLLKYSPIIVNTQGEIADGQHRWMAAQQLHVPLYYIVADDIKFSDIVLLNSVVKNWKPQDYLDHFIDQGAGDYIALKTFADKWKFSISNAVAVLSIGSDRYLKAPMREFRSGEWKITSLAHAEEFAKRYMDIAQYTEERTAKDRDLMRAVYRMYHVVEAPIEHDELMKQLKVYPYPIYRRLGMREYLRQFEDIYNFNKKSKTIRLV